LAKDYKNEKETQNIPQFVEKSAGRSKARRGHVPAVSKR